MRKTRFMTWFFLVLSLAFFPSRSFRHALEVPLFNVEMDVVNRRILNFSGYALPRRFTLERFVTTDDLLRMSEDELRQGNARLAAFAVLQVPVRDRETEMMRLADQVVQRDRSLFWIYYFLGHELYGEWDQGGEQGTKAWKAALDASDKLIQLDPGNGAPYLLRALAMYKVLWESLPKGSMSSPEYLTGLARMTAWRAEMEKFYAAPRQDLYAGRRFDLERAVLRDHGWDHPAVLVAFWGLRSIPNLLNEREYTLLLTRKLAPEAEARGQHAKAMHYFWQVVRHSERRRLGSQDILDELIAGAHFLMASERLAPALRKDGRTAEADLLELQSAAWKEEIGRHRRELSRSSNYTWSVVLVNVFATSTVVFAVLSLLAVAYVNLKLIFRRERQGRLYRIMTTSENYLALCFFVSSLALYLSFAPYAQNLRHILSTPEETKYFPTHLLRNIYPVYPSTYWGEKAGVEPDQLPPAFVFRDYLPAALAAAGVLCLVGLIQHRRRRTRSDLPG